MCHVRGEGEKNSPIKTQDTEQQQQKTSKNGNKQTSKKRLFSSANIHQTPKIPSVVLGKVCVDGVGGGMRGGAGWVRPKRDSSSWCPPEASISRVWGGAETFSLLTALQIMLSKLLTLRQTRSKRPKLASISHTHQRTGKSAFQK